jgi:transposase
MKDYELFQAALGLGNEWFVVKSDFNQDEKRLDIYLDFERGSQFECPVCHELCGVYDAKELVWQHLNFFQYKTYLHAWVPRVSCKDHGVKQIQVPWARERSGFTLLFEAMIMALVDQMPVKAIADMVGIEDTRFSCSLSPAFINGIETLFPQASITFDKFHVMKLLNQAVDETRRREQVEEKDLIKTRYIWLKNPEHLKKKQQETLQSLSTLQLKTGRAYRMKLVFQYIFKPGHVSFNREEALKKWYAWAIRSRIEPMVEFAKTLKRHWAGIVRWFMSNITNAILEGLNSLIQAAKARARGFRSIDYFKLIIYRVAGKLGYLPI